MILALVPLGAAISGSGDQMLQPLAIAIIAGALVQLPLVLLAMPVVVGSRCEGRVRRQMSVGDGSGRDDMFAARTTNKRRQRMTSTLRRAAAVSVAVLLAAGAGLASAGTVHVS